LADAFDFAAALPAFLTRLAASVFDLGVDLDFDLSFDLGGSLRVIFGMIRVY
jgi:hypothetical protein